MSEWYLASVLRVGDGLKILDTKPCKSDDYVEAWREAGQVRRGSSEACVIVIDGATARLAGIKNI